MEFVVGGQDKGKAKAEAAGWNEDLKEVNAGVIDAQDRNRYKSKIKAYDPRV